MTVRAGVLAPLLLAVLVLAWMGLVLWAMVEVGADSEPPVVMAVAALVGSFVGGGSLYYIVIGKLDERFVVRRIS